MDDKEIRAAVLSVVQSIAPEIDADHLEVDEPLRNQVDLDSMDWLNVIVRLHDKLQVEIPESDYGKLSSLNAIVSYLGSKLSPGLPG